MWPDRVSNPGPPTYESGALPTALRGPAVLCELFPQTAVLVDNCTVSRHDWQSCSIHFVLLAIPVQEFQYTASSLETHTVFDLDFCC